MIVKITPRISILKSGYKNIAFPITVKSGSRYGGFADLICSKFWPELTDIGIESIGSILTKEIDGKILYALFCHTSGINCWVKTPNILDKLVIPEDETVALLLRGMVSETSIFNLLNNLHEVAQSKTKFAIFTKYH